jgi:DNA-binding Lrp family transcriptional regulator
VPGGCLSRGYKYDQVAYSYLKVVMLVVAYVLITTATGQESHVLEEMKRFIEFTEVHQLFGQYDMIARIESKDYDDLCDVVLTKIRTITGVNGTRTLICANFKPRK